MATNDEEKLRKLQENNSSTLAQRWSTLSKVECLRAALFQYWAVHVPCIYTLAGDVDSAQQDATARDLLFSPMEWLICNDDPKTTFTELKQLDDPPKLCGRVFKVGEPTYSC
ncbi:E3 ubiquitin-protein ligase UBR2-like, partial [Saccoglossus kowalevskii]